VTFSKFFIVIIAAINTDRIGSAPKVMYIAYKHNYDGRQKDEISL